MQPQIRVRQVAVVAATVCVALLVLAVLVGAMVAARPSAGPAPVAPAGSSAPAATPAAPTPADWTDVVVEPASYAVPPSWRPRAGSGRSVYREDGAVLASGRGLAESFANECRTDFVPVPVAWAVVSDPVRSTSPAGVARAVVAGWARGYAAGPSVPLEASPAEPLPLADGTTGQLARIALVLRDSANPCVGERAELSAVAVQDGALVRTLVVARYTDVDGAPDDAAYDGVLRSFTLR